jgi:hypothetical protein
VVKGTLEAGCRVDLHKIEHVHGGEGGDRRRNRGCCPSEHCQFMFMKFCFVGLSSSGELATYSFEEGTRFGWAREVRLTARVWQHRGRPMGIWGPTS